MTITKLSWYAYNRLMENVRELWKKANVPITRHNFLTIIKQLFMTLVPIVWFVAIQTRSMATKMGTN